MNRAENEHNDQFLMHPYFVIYVLYIILKEVVRSLLNTL